MFKSSFQSSRLVERRYQRLLEDEQKCLARNKKLLEDIDRLEEQMEYFSHECKQDEEKLDHAKDKFMQYVKSVYPKWSVDLKRWQESRNKSKNPIAQSDQNRTSANPGSALHSTPRKNQLSFERSTSQNLHTLEDTGTKYKGSLRYPRGTNGSYMDKTDHDKDKLGYPEKRTSFMNGSLRDRTDLSWDEMGFHKGYSGNDMRYPWDGTMVYPQHSPHGMYSHPVHPYFVPMPAYGMPRWSTPGYHDPWSTSYAHGTSFEDYNKDGRQGVSFERQKHDSYERDERPQEHETLQKDVLPNSENRDSFSRFYAENLPDNGGYPTGHYSDRKQDLSGSSMREADTQQLSRGEVSYNRSMNAKASQDHSEDGRSHDQEKINRQAPRKEIKDGLSQHSDVNNEKYMQKKNNPDENFNDKLPEHTTINSGDFGKQHHMGGREYFVEPVQDARLMQLRGEGSEFEGGEVINTDSISLPTIHQYEGDPGEIFSDISSSEPANQDDSRRVESKHSEVGGNLNNQPPSSKVEIEQHSDRDNDGQVKHGPGPIGDDRGQEKNDEIKSNVSAKNKVHKNGGDKRLLTSEVSESKTSVVEDLIGDDVSDFEVSDDSEHSEVGFQNNAPVALASGNVEEETTGLAGHKMEDICDQNANEKKAKQTSVMPESMNEGEYSSFPNDALAGYEETETRIEDKAPEKDVAGNTAIATNNLSNKSAKQQNEVAGSVVAPLRNETENLKEDEVPTETSEDRLHEQNVDVDGFSRENEPTHPSEEFIEEELEKTHDDISIGQSKIVEDHDHEDEEITNDSRKESKESGVAVLVNEKGEDNVKKSLRKFLSGDKKSKSGVLEELSLSSVESSSESSPVQRNNASKKKVVDSNISYSEDFEEKSISLTQSAVYQKMLSTVHVSDEGEDFEEEFLEGTMSEANTTAQSTHNPEQTLPDARTSQAKLPAKSSRPTLSLFNSAERDDFGSSFGKEEAGLSASWQSSDGTLSPPLSPDTGGYVPSVAVGGKMGNKQKEERGSVPPVGKTTDGNTEKEKIEPKPQDSNTKARIQAGFWNQSDSESEVDLQVSHGGQNNDANDDDDFDFYS